MSYRLDLKLRLVHDEEIAMGPGKADLLEAIAEAGSISAAARKLDMSYRRAWLLVDVMNRCFRDPLVDRAAGGAHGGGAQLTGCGLQVLTEFRAMEAAAASAAASHISTLSNLLK